MFTRTTYSTARTTPALPPERRHRRLCLAAVGVTGLLALSACSTDETTQDTTENTTENTADAADSTGSESTTDTGSSDVLATASVANADGEEVGTAEISGADGASELSVDVSGLEPGMYGMHLHAVGACEPDSTAPDADADDPETGDFLSAGGHLGADGHDHPDHGGDLPALLVNEDGSGSMTVTTDRIDEAELLDDDGSAIIIHEDADNYGNVPERYAPDGPDEDTLSTGDAGGRQACGVFEAV
ncbi:MAG: superoxide dismutase family protein [Candidatus Corynebacterium faecigallinarum]|uniref:superoxide dismutase family protein n=1 Tax=Corynebacterium TaxID=1716 RepID=UPI003FB745C8